MSNGGWIAVDLDGTLAEYDGFVSPSHIGPPIHKMALRVKKWLEEDQEVRIFTARVYYPEGNVHRKQQTDEAREAITTWCEKHFGRPLKITCVKDYNMIQLFDDRAVQVQQNTGRILTEEGWV